MGIARVAAVALVTATLVWFCACGGSDSPAGPGNGGGTPGDTAGVAWSSEAFPNSMDGFDVVWTGGQFVAVGSTGGAVSPDGRTWTATAGFGAKQLRFGNGVLVGLFPYAYGGSVWRSTDGVNWANTTPDYTGSTSESFDYLLFHRGTFYITGTYYPSYGWMAESSTGQSWSISSGGDMWDVKKAIADDPLQTTGPISLFWKAKVGGPGYVAHLGGATTTLELNDVTYGNSWVIVGDSGVVFTSTDGQNWLRASTPVAGTSKHLQAVIWTGTVYVAVGNFGTIITSPTGQTWTQRSSGVSYDLRGLAWSGQRVVAIGSGGFLTSP